MRLTCPHCGERDLREFTYRGAATWLDRPDPDAGVIAEGSRKPMHEVRDGLPERERKVLEMRYGIKDDEPMTLREIGEELELSRERVRQIEARALRRLRKEQKARELKKF